MADSEGQANLSAFQARAMAVAQVKLAVRAMGVKGKYLEVAAEKLLKYLEAICDSVARLVW